MDSSPQHLHLQKLNLIDFLRSFAKRVEKAIATIGIQFIEENCVFQMRNSGGGERERYSNKNDGESEISESLN